MSPVPGEQWKEYAGDVWREFTRRTGKPERIMSPQEWWELRGWMLTGIPLRIVLTAMGETKGQPGTLVYYHHPVRVEYERWRQAIGGTV